MKDSIVVIESMDLLNERILKKYAKKCKGVYVLEPFVGYHKRKGYFAGSPRHLPGYVRDLIRKGEVQLLPAKELNAKTIYALAADKAVESIEDVFSCHERKFKKLFHAVRDMLNDADAVNAFKINLCDRLACFYSANMLFERIDKHFDSNIFVHADVNIFEYRRIERLLSECNQNPFELKKIRFLPVTRLASMLESISSHILIYAKILLQWLGSSAATLFFRNKIKEKRNFKYAFAINSPLRQLRGVQTRIKFIIDHNRIKDEDVVFIPLTKSLTDEQKNELKKISRNIYYPPGPRQIFSHASQWFKLFCLSLLQNPGVNNHEIFTASKVIFDYFAWAKIVQAVEIQNFITQCGFGVSHVGRNIALRQAGTKTWYLTDSMNLGCNSHWDTRKYRVRHPYWTYLLYDHFVTWDQAIADFFQNHPTSLKQTHIVGCLWSQHIKEFSQQGDQFIRKFNVDRFNNFVIAAFDITYSLNGFATYREGIIFARDLLRIVEEDEDVCLMLKEKKDRFLHQLTDPQDGLKLIEIYEKMNDHPRINIIPKYEDTSKVIACADLTVSFPFTSPTFEALSVNKPGIWHDPDGEYRDAPYSRLGGVVTHGYQELKNKVNEIKSLSEGEFKNPINVDSVYLDPFRDGKAIDRLRDLISA